MPSEARRRQRRQKLGPLRRDRDGCRLSHPGSRHLGKPSRPGALGHPLTKVGRGRWYLALGTALQVQRLRGADHTAQPATYAAALIHLTDETRFRHCQSPELAPLDAITAARTRVGIDERDKVGAGDCRRDAEFRYAAEHAAATRAAVSYVVVSIAIVAGRVHQPCVLCLAQDAKCFLLADRA